MYSYNRACHRVQVYNTVLVSYNTIITSNKVIDELEHGLEIILICTYLHLVVGPLSWFQFEAYLTKYEPNLIVLPTCEIITK